MDDAAVLNEKGHRELVVDVAEHNKFRVSNVVFIDHPVPRGTAKVTWLGACFLLLFISFNLAQSRITTLYPTHGFYSLALIYAAFLVSSLVAPYLIPSKLASARWTFFFAAVPYVTFVLSVNLGAVPLLVASVLVGIGAGLLWLQQGIYVAQISQLGGGKIGRLTSTFLLILQLNMIIGNGLSYALEVSGAPVSTIIWVLTGVASVSAIGLLGVHDLPSSGRALSVDSQFAPVPVAVKSSGSVGVGATPRVTSKSLPRDTLETTSLITRFRRVARAPCVVYLHPLMAFNGAVNALIFGTLPLYVPRPAPGQPAPQVAILYAVYGTAAVLATPIWGRLFDWFGARGLLAGLGVVGAAAMSAYLALFIVPGAPTGLLLSVAALLAALETATASFLNMYISTAVKTQLGGSDLATGTAFGIFRVQFCLAFVIVSVIASAATPVAYAAVYAITALEFAGAVVAAGWMLRMLDRGDTRWKRASGESAVPVPMAATAAVVPSSKPRAVQEPVSLPAAQAAALGLALPTGIPSANRSTGVGAVPSFDMASMAMAAIAKAKPASNFQQLDGDEAGRA
ncbi:DUF895 domain membrane protein [Allomyces javanicus]|nr:DUF895 domain membrane protein [Allomyces javanicus]